MTEHIDLNQNNISGTVLADDGTANSGVPILVRHVESDTLVIDRAYGKATGANGNFTIDADNDPIPATYIAGDAEDIDMLEIWAEFGDGDATSQGESLYDSGGDARMYPIAYSYTIDMPQTGLIHHYNPANITASTGSAVSTFPDSEGSLDLTGGDPIYEANGMGNADVPVYDATDDQLQASSAADWTLLHDGSEFEMFLVFQPDPNTMTDAVAHVAGTMSFTNDDRGFFVALDDRIGENRNKKLIVGVGNGSGGFVLEFLSTDNVVNYDEPNIVNVRYDGTDTYVVEHNDTELTSTTAGGHDTSNPEGAYAHGSTPGSFAAEFGGGVGDNLIYTSQLSSSDRSSAWSNLASKYGVTL
mgnify:CR=1 FL=1